MVRRKCSLSIVSRPLDIMCAMQDALAMLQCSEKPVAGLTHYTATGLWLRQAYRIMSAPIDPLWLCRSTRPNKTNKWASYEGSKKNKRSRVMTDYFQIGRLAVSKICDGKAVPFTASFVRSFLVAKASVVTLPIPSTSKPQGLTTNLVLNSVVIPRLCPLLTRVNLSITSTRTQTCISTHTQR